VGAGAGGSKERSITFAILGTPFEFIAKTKYFPGMTTLRLDGIMISNSPLPREVTSFKGIRIWSLLTAWVAAPYLTRANVWAVLVSMLTVIGLPTSKISGGEMETITGRTAGFPFASFR